MTVLLIIGGVVVGVIVGGVAVARYFGKAISDGIGRGL